MSLTSISWEETEFLLGRPEKKEPPLPELLPGAPWRDVAMHFYDIINELQEIRSQLQVKYNLDQTATKMSPKWRPKNSNDLRTQAAQEVSLIIEVGLSVAGSFMVGHQDLQHQKLSVSVAMLQLARHQWRILENFQRHQAWTRAWEKIHARFGSIEKWLSVRPGLRGALFGTGIILGTAGVAAIPLYVLPAVAFGGPFAIAGTVVALILAGLIGYAYHVWKKHEREHSFNSNLYQSLVTFQAELQTEPKLQALLRQLQEIQKEGSQRWISVAPANLLHIGECPICLEPMKVGSQRLASPANPECATHRFHHDCLDPVAPRGAGGIRVGRCPMCRRGVMHLRHFWVVPGTSTLYITSQRPDRLPAK